MNFIAIDVLSNSYFTKQLDSLSEREPLQLHTILVVAPYHFKKEEGYFFM